jgi:DNA-binding PadR family transcriptional regulator
MHDNFDRWERGWRKFEHMAQRFGRHAGRDFARTWDGFGENFRIGRMLASGDLRLVALYLIEQQPRHGYDLIKAIEEKSKGFYSPSPGVVYPALTFLEEAGYVTASAEGNKKLYTITDEGRAHLADNREAIQSTLDFLEKAGERMSAWREKMAEEWPFGGERHEEHGSGVHGRRHRHGPPPPDRDTPNTTAEFNDARRDLKAAIADAIAAGEDEQHRVAGILRRAAEEIRRQGSGEDVVDL